MVRHGIQIIFVTFYKSVECVGDRICNTETIFVGQRYKTFRDGPDV